MRVIEKTIQGWKGELLRVHQRAVDLFSRSEVRERSLVYLQCLLSHCERKNSWQVAERADGSSENCSGVDAIDIPSSTHTAEYPLPGTAPTAEIGCGRDAQLASPSRLDGQISRSGIAAPPAAFTVMPELHREDARKFIHHPSLFVSVSRTIYAFSKRGCLKGKLFRKISMKRLCLPSTIVQPSCH